MAKKKEVKKESIEEKLNKNPLYMKVCEDSSTCEKGTKEVDLGDMIAWVCPQ